MPRRRKAPCHPGAARDLAEPLGRNGMRHGRIATTRVDYGSEEAAMQAYLRDGERRAAGLGNRGPIRFTAAGELHPDIVEAYWRCGFYVFEGVLKADELADIERDLHDILDRLPAERGARARRQGPAGAGGRLHGARTCCGRKPLGDPFGGTELANGRHPVKMFEPKAAADAPQGSRLSHPGLAAVLRGGAARLRPSRASRRRRGDQRSGLHAVQRGAVHQGAGPRRLGGLAPGRHHALGQPRLGPGHATASTSWASSTAARRPTACGSCRARTSTARSTSRRWSAEAGSERLPDAVPIIARPGDVAITNRQALHGSFANTSKDWRVTVNFGFHRRRSVLGVKGGGVHNAAASTTPSASASARA